VQRPPPLERFIVTRLPADGLRHDLQARLKVERERSLVLKDYFDNVVIRSDRQFHFGNNLALCLGKLEDPLVRFFSSARTFSLVCSHVASHTGDLVRAASVLRHRRSPFAWTYNSLARWIATRKSLVVPLIAHHS
jgi:hypothetical protein